MRNVLFLSFFLLYRICALVEDFFLLQKNECLFCAIYYCMNPSLTLYTIIITRQTKAILMYHVLNVSKYTGKHVIFQLRKVVIAKILEGGTITIIRVRIMWTNYSAIMHYNYTGMAWWHIELMLEIIVVCNFAMQINFGDHKKINLMPCTQYLLLLLRSILHIPIEQK